MMLLALFVGLGRIRQMELIRCDPLITALLKLPKLPHFTTIWRFVGALRIWNTTQLLKLMKALRERVWQGSRLVMKAATMDTDTSVETVYGDQQGARKGYNPKNKGKKSYQPVFTFVAETREFLHGKQRNGSTMDGKEMAAHIEEAYRALPETVERVRARADAGFYCKEVMDKYEELAVDYVVVVPKNEAIKAKLSAAQWEEVKGTDGACEFSYQASGWAAPRRFVAARHLKDEGEEAIQYQLFDDARYTYRVFVTRFSWSIGKVIEFYAGRANAENMIKEAKNDAFAKAIPSRLFAVNMCFFIITMLAYNLHRWLQLFTREDSAEAQADPMRLQTFRSAYVYLAARLSHSKRQWRLHFSDSVPAEIRHRLLALLNRLNRLIVQGNNVAPVYVVPYTPCLL